MIKEVVGKVEELKVHAEKSTKTNPRKISFRRCASMEEGEAAPDMEVTDEDSAEMYDESFRSLEAGQSSRGAYLN